jgi:hypothetical protein
MGLDMYLYKDTYVGANFEHNNVTGSVDLQRGDYKIPVNMKRLSSIREEVGYWRKANAIHYWFVKNIQNGEDNCGTYYVSREALRELYSTVAEVLANPSEAPDLLPTEGGFFFGDTDYDDWYLRSLRYTADLLRGLLNEPEDGDFYYHSSW